jgi:hypothetical protein
MPFSIELRSDVGVVELTFEGAVDFIQLHKAWQKVHRLLPEGAVRTVLIDMRKIDWHMSLFDIMDFAEKIHPTHLRIAIVCRADDDDARFFVMVAQNRGRFVEMFTDYAKAKKVMES